VLAKDQADAQAALQDGTARVEALEGAAREIDAEVTAIRDSHLEYFCRKAHSASLEAVQALDAASAALEHGHRQWRTAHDLWSQVRMSRKRKELPDIPGVPIADLDSVMSGFRLSRRDPFPGSRPLSDQELARTWAPGEWRRDADVVARPSTPATDSGEPIIEFI
jgi:hypothetical protein